MSYKIIKEKVTEKRAKNEGRKQMLNFWRRIFFKF
jgi:hypothetical protein